MKTILAFFRRLFCQHSTGNVLQVSFDGETIYECDRCGKIIKVPL